MKKHFLLPVAALAAAVFTLTACNKESTYTPPQTSSLGAELSKMATPSKVVTFNATTGATFNGNAGTRFTFPPSAFRLADGSVVTGNVSVQVTEWINRADMAFGTVLPYSNGFPLSSAGELEVTATIPGGQIAYLRPGMTYTASMPQGGPAPTGMQAFFGKKISPVGVNTVNWVPADTAHGPFMFVGPNGDSVTLVSDSLGLGNADRFLSNPNYQTFQVQIAGLPSDVTFETRAFAFFDGQKTAWNMWHLTGNTISEDHTPNIPVHFVVIAYGDGKLYGGVTAATPATGSTYTVNMSEQTPTALKAQLAAIP